MVRLDKVLVDFVGTVFVILVAPNQGLGALKGSEAEVERGNPLGRVLVFQRLDGANRVGRVVFLGLWYVQHLEGRKTKDRTRDGHVALPGRSYQAFATV